MMSSGLGKVNQFKKMVKIIMSMVLIKRDINGLEKWDVVLGTKSRLQWCKL